MAHKRLAFFAVAALLFAGCLSVPGEERREAWRLERPPPSQVGEEASFQVNARPWHLFGQMDVGVLQAPFHLLPAPDGDQGHWLFFRDARVPGYLAGTLVIEGASVAVDAGTIAGLRIDGAHGGDTLRWDATPTTPKPAPSSIDLPPGWDLGERAFTRSEWIAAPVSGVTVTGFVRAMLWTPEESVELEEVPTFSAAGWRWMEASQVAPPAGTYQISTDRFVLGGGLRGAVETQTHGRIIDPSAVFGNIATINMEASRLWTEGTFRVTQVLRGDRPLFAAEVETDVVTPVTVVAKGRTAWVPVNYREATFRGGAVLQDVQVTGSASDMTRLPTRSEWQTEALWKTVAESGETGAWAASFRQVPLTLATPFAPKAGPASCTFGECPENHPYSVWLPAAEVGLFYLRVAADKGPGTYDATVWLHGHNFDTETFNFQVRVTEG